MFKYRSIGIMLLILCVGVASAYAGGAGNCVQPIKKTSKYIGLGGAGEFNYVHERMNKLDNRKGPRGMKVEKLWQVYGKGIIGLGDYVNFYGKAGVANYDLEFVDRPQDIKYDVELEDGIYTGAGINALFPLVEWKPVSLGIGMDVQGNFFLNKVKSMNVDGAEANSVDGSFYGVDGQNSLYLTARYDIESIKTSIVPYVGGYHSWIVVGTAETLTYGNTPKSSYDTEDFQGAFDVTSFGILVGVDVDVMQFVNLNVEGRFIGETAITTGATVKF